MTKSIAESTLHAVQFEKADTDHSQNSQAGDGDQASGAPESLRQPFAPWLYRVKPVHSGPARCKAVIVLAGCTALIFVAARLQPDDSRVGTSHQLGYGPCSFPMRFGMPCPTCGMTTAFAHAVRGQWPASFHAQPTGFLAAILTGLIGFAALNVAVTGRVWVVNWFCVSPGWIAVVLVGVLLAGWCYKIVSWRNAFPDLGAIR